ncbi:MAG: hypothetical protein N2117_03450 [Anaerolineales bacterium]|nr:hypothetical protein [Anaerolineales bacterium]MCX7754288.1 hypothetical protein [Anaerolineales bacterium]MDW8278677.1 hypothetical protein [Anaerolineales bacterium]
MPRKLNFHTLLGPLVALLMVLTLLLVSATPAFADDDPPKPIPGLGKVSNADLTSMYKKLRAWYDSQAIVIRESYELAKQFQTVIDFYKKKGRDVTGLETALVRFNDEIIKAEAARVYTNSLFTRNAGFNGFFVVLDRSLAAQTILEARTSLKGTHMDLEEAVRNLKRDYNAWRRWMLGYQN